MLKKFIFSLFFIGGIVACSNDNEQDLTPENETENNGCNTDEISYNTGIAAILTENCNMAGCHNSSGAHPLTNYEELMIYVNSGAFERRVIEQKNMPPAGSLTDCELEKITAWLGSGAPENS